ncbi:HisA/HisF-related TIM barrel protein [Paenibacillus lautus]|uniref:HisA/HisF-related TIM barrel protein n=1 Tax=Paenibacillus lautus TaxID=1401 RepID=UPI000BBD9BA8|nr:HisA/HisF-related TIM barrel protein [Paenibacillus lautus]PCL90073.1 hypothetical protein CPZ30_26365 [Paenibacillus lautus]
MITIKLLPSEDGASSWRLNVDVANSRVISRSTEDLEYFTDKLIRLQIPACLIDLDASKSTLSSFSPVISSVVRNTPNYFGVGGGISSIDQIDKHLEIGAKYVIISSALFKDSEIDMGFIQDINRHFDADQIIYSIDLFGDALLVKGFTQSIHVAWQKTIHRLNETLTPRAQIQIVDAQASLNNRSVNFRLLETVMHQCNNFNYWYGGNITNWTQFRKVQELGFSPVMGKAYLTGILGLPE